MRASWVAAPTRRAKDLATRRSSKSVGSGAASAFVPGESRVGDNPMALAVAAAAAAPPIVPMNLRRLGNDTVWGSRSTVEGRVSKITGGSVTAGLLLTHLFIVPDPTTDPRSHFGKILPPKAKMVKIMYSSNNVLVLSYQDRNVPVFSKIEMF